MTTTEPGTAVLTDKSDRNIAVVIGTIGVVTAVAAAIVAFAAEDKTPSIVMGAIAAVLLLIGGWVLRKTAVWHNPELFLPSSAPFRLGSESVARFRRRTRRHGSARDATVTVVLKCVESATYTVGTDRHTATHTLFELEQETTLYPSADVLEVDISIAIPLFDGPPTMDLGDNEVSWALEVDIDAPNAPDDKSRFPLVIAPEVVT